MRHDGDATRTARDVLAASRKPRPDISSKKKAESGTGGRAREGWTRGEGTSVAVGASIDFLDARRALHGVDVACRFEQRLLRPPASPRRHYTPPRLCTRSLASFLHACHQDRPTRQDDRLVAESGRVSVECILRDDLDAAQDDRRVPGLPHAFRHYPVPLLHPHQQLPFQRFLGWVRNPFGSSRAPELK